MSKPTKKPEELLSLSTLSRRLDIPYVRAVELRANGVLIPDFVAKQQFLFRPSRLPELHELIQL
jgi:hypothetical protein